MKKKTVYLSGKITGLPFWYAWLKFMIYDLYLTLLGFDVCNPIKTVPKNKNWHESMKICIENLRKCDYIFMQYGWRSSIGANVEFIEAAIQRIYLINGSKKTRDKFDSLIPKLNDPSY